MRNASTRENTVVAFTNWVIRYRWAVLFFTIAIAAIAGSGGSKLRFASDYRYFFGETNPQLRAFDELQETFIRDDGLLIVIRPEEDVVFTPTFLADLRELTENAWSTPYNTRVDSITNFQHSFADGDLLSVRDLVPGDRVLTQANIEEIRQIALSEPTLAGRLISNDGRTVAVNITTTLPSVSDKEVPAVMEFVRNLAVKFESAHPNARVAITGSVATNNAFNEAALSDMSTLVPLMYISLLVITFLLLRSVASTLATLWVIGFSTVWAVGMAGWLGIPLTSMSANAPTIILTIAIADSIHILITLIHEMREGRPKQDAIIEAMRVNWQPVFLTSLTTIIGFLSLNFNDAPPFQDLGNMTAIGIAAAWLYSILFLPAILAVLPIRVSRQHEGNMKALEKLYTLLVARRRTVLYATTALVAGLIMLIPKLVVNDQFVSYFNEEGAYRSDTEFTAEHLSGMYQMQFSLPAAESGGINDPVYLRNLEAFSSWLRDRPEVNHVLAISDLYPRINMNMHADDETWYRLPDNRDAAAQYLLLLEMSLPYGLDLNNQINVDKSTTRLIATIDNLATMETQALDKESSEWLTRNFPSAAEATATGPFVMFAYIFQNNIEGMLTGTTVAFVLIALTLIMSFRNFKLGIISLVPNLLPALMAFGTWAIFVGQVDLAASIVTATSLGMIVDATVHFLSKYRRARIEHSATAEEAVHYAYHTVGKAILVTSMILIAGFLVLVFSEFKLNQNMGLLTATAIAYAVVIDFLLLPALLLLIDKEKHQVIRRQPEVVKLATKSAE